MSAASESYVTSAPPEAKKGSAAEAPSSERRLNMDVFSPLAVPGPRREPRAGHERRASCDESAALSADQAAD